MRIIISGILLTISLLLHAQYTLTIEIKNLRNSYGRVHLLLNNEKEHKVAGLSKYIQDKKCVFVIENLKPGKYAAKFIHDENNNEKLETNWMGIPREGFGFSNNPVLIFGPPSHEDTLFDLNINKTVFIKTRYILSSEIRKAKLRE